jgi:hypothetical protein
MGTICCRQTNTPTVVLTERDRIRLRYEGDRAITIIGPVTGRRYEFSAPGESALVDARDAPALLSSRCFRWAGVVRESSDRVSSKRAP